MRDNRMSIGQGRLMSPRRIAKIAVVVLGIGAFGAAGLSGALAQDDSIFGENWPFPSGGSGIFGDDWPFPSGGSGGTGGSGGDINVGGSTGGSITMGGSGGGEISIGGGSSNSGSGGGEYLYP